MARSSVGGRYRRGGRDGGPSGGSASARGGGRASSSDVGSGTAEHGGGGASPRVTGRDLVSRSLGFTSSRTPSVWSEPSWSSRSSPRSSSQPLLSGAFFQSLVVPPRPPRDQAGAVRLLVAYALEPVCTYLYVTTMSRVAQDFVSDLHGSSLHPLTRHGLLRPQRHDVLLSIVSTEVNTVADVLGGNLSRDRGLRRCSGRREVVVLGMIAPQLAPVLLAFIFLTSVNAALYSRTTRALRAQGDLQLKMNAGATTAFSNIKTVIPAAEGHEFRGFLGMLRRADGIGLSLGESKARLESLSRFAIYQPDPAVCVWREPGRQRPYAVKSLFAGIGTFSLVFATQGITNTFADAQGDGVDQKDPGFVDAASSPDGGLDGGGDPRGLGPSARSARTTVGRSSLPPPPP